MLPALDRDETGDAYVAAEGGEPWRTFLSTSDMAALLGRHGFTKTRAVSQRESVAETQWSRTDTLCPIRLSAIALAVVSPAPA